MAAKTPSKSVSKKSSGSKKDGKKVKDTEVMSGKSAKVKKIV